MIWLVLASALAGAVAPLSCPEDRVLSSNGAWCRTDDGTVDGPMRFERDGVVQGVVTQGRPVGVWTSTWPDGTPKASSPVTPDVAEGCRASDGACLAEQVADELVSWHKRAKRLRRPALAFVDRKGAALDGVDFSKLFRVDEHVRATRGFGLPAGKTALWNKEGRKLLEMEHDDEGRLTGTFTYFESRGRPLRRAHYREGMLHGREEVWDMGLRIGEVHWVANVPNGAMRWWDTHGRQILQGGFMDGVPCRPFSITGIAVIGLERGCAYTSEPL